MRNTEEGFEAASCWGATTEQLDLPERTDGLAHNLPPLDSVRFGQQFSGPIMGFDRAHLSSAKQKHPNGTPFGLYNLDEGGYNPGTGIHTVRPLRPWHNGEKE